MVEPKNSSTQLLIRFGYDGSRFHGLQPQPHDSTAGGALLARIQQATGVVPYAVSFAARTDAGVHALANLATCRVRTAADLSGWRESLARPRDDGLRNLRLGILPARAMARSMACSKVYAYRIATGRFAAREDKDAWRVVPPLRLAPMRQAARLLLGTHDFTSFAAAACEAKNPVKTLTAIRLVDGPTHLTMEVEGDAFLRKMVRILVGTLAEIGCGLRQAESIGPILAARQRHAAGVGAPARGLTLVGIRCAMDLDATLGPCPGPLLLL